MKISLTLASFPKTNLNYNSGIMSSQKLMRSEKNQVLQIIQEEGLDPANFEWGETKSSRAHTSFAYDEKVPILVYKGTEYYCIFGHKDYVYDLEFSPGKNRIVQRTATVLSWDHLLHYFREWLECLKRELAEPDLWGELLKSIQLEKITPDTTDEPFTEPELDKISDGIETIRAYIESEFKLNAEQKEHVNQQLDYLVAELKRQGKRSWYYFMTGNIMYLAHYLPASLEQINTIWNFIKYPLKDIYQLLPF